MTNCHQTKKLILQKFYITAIHPPIMETLKSVGKIIIKIDRVEMFFFLFHINIHLRCTKTTDYKCPRKYLRKRSNI